MPCFVIAAIIESYVTRYYKEMGFWAEFGIILISLLFMVFYFIIYPIITHNKYEKPK
jgi:membrane protein YdbS with pleckstrin-like domain